MNKSTRQNQYEKRADLLTADLTQYSPQSWRPNWPGKHYRIRIEDWIPALAGVIGKAALAAAFAVAWANGLGLQDSTFVAENVRLELWVASVLTLIFSAFLNPRLGPPGTLAPLIPLIPAMIAAKVHPLPFAILLGLAGLLLSGTRSFTRILTWTGPGTKSGMMALFGLLGVAGSVRSLVEWSRTNQAGTLVSLLLSGGVLLVLVFHYYKIRWLTIPAIAGLAGVMAVLFNTWPMSQTGIGFPILDPQHWWFERWGLGWGLNLRNFIAAGPFVLLALVMWPMDALAIRSLLENNYPRGAQRAMFKLNATYMLVSARTILGAVLGGAQTAAIWRSFMIPLAIVKRPIGGSALLLGLLGLVVSVLGFPLDWATFPPLLWPVLIFGVFLPLIETGAVTLLHSRRMLIPAGCCIATGLLIHPVAGWLTGFVVEKLQDRLIKRRNSVH